MILPLGFSNHPDPRVLLSYLASFLSISISVSTKVDVHISFVASLSSNFYNRTSSLFTLTDI